MLLSKQENNIALFFTPGRHDNFDIDYISQSLFHLSKITIRCNSNIIILTEQILRVIIKLSQDVAGLDMNLEEWKQLRRKTWDNHCEYLQLDRFAKKREGRFIFRNCNKNTHEEFTPETKPS